MSQTVVKLRVFKGKEVLLKADGKTPANENELLTLTYNDLQWKNHLNNLKKMGICKVSIENVYKVDKSGETEIEIPKELSNEIDSLLKVDAKELTPEQKAISELREENRLLSEKLEAFMSSGNNNFETSNYAKSLNVVGEKKEDGVIDLVAGNTETTGAGESTEDTVKTDNEDLGSLKKKYFEKFQKEVPNPYSKNIAWIKTKLEE